MSRTLYIAEKPSVAQEFAKALKYRLTRRDGYLESKEAIFTWCVGHLVTMSYPESYNPSLKRWSMDTLPFIPDKYRYEVIPSVKKQFEIVKNLLTGNDIDTIYVCTDSGREGEYIYRLVAEMCGIKGKNQKRVWIDSQTEEEIIRGISTAKDLSEYDHLADSAYLRAQEDYLMGINFSRALTLKYGNTLSSCLKTDRTVISVGRVMTCVLGIVVNREQEIRNFVKMPFYRVIANIQSNEFIIESEWKAVPESSEYGKNYLYKDIGFQDKAKAEALIEHLSQPEPVMAGLVKSERKKEKKAAPLLYNLAELQNDCSRLFKLSPDETLRITQELYEKKLVTYPRTDARVLSMAVAKEIHKNIKGLGAVAELAGFSAVILEKELYKGLAKTKYVNDKQITDHYAIVPTGQSGAFKGLSQTARAVYIKIAKRFLSIFYPAAIYQKYSLEYMIKEEHFFTSYRVLEEEGWLAVAGVPGNDSQASGAAEVSAEGAQNNKNNPEFIKMLGTLRKNQHYPVAGFNIRDSETTPPKRYNSGTLILAMENAGQLIEDEDLRSQIKGSGIGTSATRAEILKKLVTIKYLSLNKKTQIITPTLLGESIYHVVACSMRSMLNPELTASWEKGLSGVAKGEITPEEYNGKLNNFVCRRVSHVKQVDNSAYVRGIYQTISHYYKK